MDKLLLLSMLIATVAIPVIASKERVRAVGYKKTMVWMALFCVFYMFALIHIWPRLEGG